MSFKGSFISGLGSGSGGSGSVSYPLLAPVGSSGAPSYSFSANPNTGLYTVGGQLTIANAGANILLVSSSLVRVSSTVRYAWSAGDTGAAGEDVNIYRVAAGVFSSGSTGSDGLGWFQNGGEACLAANATNATATLAVTNLSVTLVAGRTYNFELNVFISESTAVDGWQLDFAGGTATITNFIAQALSSAETGIAVVLANATSAALATVINATSTVTTGGQMIKIQGSIVCLAGGTFIPRFAQNTHSTGTLTIKRGSNLIMRDSKAL